MNCLSGLHQTCQTRIRYISILQFASLKGPGYHWEGALHFPFQVYGSPLLPDNGFSFTPDSTFGSKNPPLRRQKCYGADLRNAMKNGLVPVPKMTLEWVIDAYNNYPEKDKFFTSYFDVLSGGPTIREQIQKGMSSDQIRDTWKDGLEKFSKIRAKYLLYK